MGLTVVPSSAPPSVPSPSTPAPAEAAQPAPPPGGLGVEIVGPGASKVLANPQLDGATRSPPIAVAQGVFQAAGLRLGQYYWRDSKGVHGYDEDNPQKRYQEWAACGETSTVMVLNAFGHFATVEGADEHLRMAWGLGGPLAGLIEYYKARGLSADLRYGGTVADLERALRDGFAVVVHMGGWAPHTVRVIGVLTGTDGTKYIQLQETDGGDPECMLLSTFEQRWKHLRLAGPDGLDTGIECAFQLIGKPGSTLPKGGSCAAERRAKASEQMLEAFDQTTVAIDYLRHGEVIGGMARLQSGLARAASMVSTAGLQAQGAALEWTGVPGVADVGRWLREKAQAAGSASAERGAVLAKTSARLADRFHADNDATSHLRYANPAGTPRERAYWQMLCATPVVPGKLYLMQRLLAGSVKPQERVMALRLLDACLNGAAAQLIDAVGEAKLSRVFAQTAQQPEWEKALERARRTARNDATDLSGVGRPPRGLAGLAPPRRIGV